MSAAQSEARHTASSLAPLFTTEGWTLLNSLGHYDPSRALELNDRLRRAGHSPELVAAVLTQSRLRAKAKAKFGAFAHDMLFTEIGLEQATRLPLAARHAHRFAAALAHPTAEQPRIADLGCGIGSDSLAFATLDLNVTAVEVDELTAACATVNLMPFANAVVRHAEATEVDLSAMDAVWLDPARRQTGSSGTQRLFDPEAFSPPLSFASGIADQGMPTGVKLGPGVPHAALPDSAETQWTSVDGELLEATLWFNAVSRPGIRRSALVLHSRARPSAERQENRPGHGDSGHGESSHGKTVPGQQDLTAAELTSPVAYDPDRQDPPLGPVSEYLYEPDPAVIRAGLVADLAQNAGMHLFDPQIAYLGAKTAVTTPFARGYRVLEVLPYHHKTLRAWLRERDIGILDIKKRGAAVTPEELRRQLLPGSRKAKGHNTAERRSMTLVLTRIGDQRHAIAVEPLPVP